MTARPSLRSRLDFLFTRIPRCYAFLLSRYRPLDPDKILFLRILRPGGVVIDAGANIGHYTRLFSHLVGGQGRVHAFEPAPSTFRSLSANLEIDKRFDNVVLQRLALAGSPGTALLHTPADDHGQASLTVHSGGSWERGSINRVSCTTTTLDAYAGSAALARLDLIKLDIEGAELPALQGATRTLAALRPALHVEVCGQWTRDFGYQPSELVAFLAGLGYDRLFTITSSGGLERIRDTAVLATGASTNVYCPGKDLGRP